MTSAERPLSHVPVPSPEMGDRGTETSDDGRAANRDPALAALLQVADRATVRSVKETILTCLIIRSVRARSRTRSRRALASVLALSAAIAGGHYWHTWSALAHLFHH